MEQNSTMTPVGYVFRPEPEELLWFLRESIMLQDNWIRPREIRHLDLYASNPWTLLGGSSDQPYYVTTRLKKMVPGKSKIKRTAGVGTWKLQKSSDVTVQFQDGVKKLKGLKRYFAFQVEKSKQDCLYSPEVHGHWIMNEYSLLVDGFEDYVICEIHKKASSKSSPSFKRKHDDHGDDDDQQSQVVMKKMRSTTLSPTTTTSSSDRDDDVDECIQELVDLVNGLVEDDVVQSNSGDHDWQEVVMTMARSSTCDDDSQELVDLIESQVEGGVDDIAVCDSPAPVVDSDHDRRRSSTCDEDDDDDQELVDLIESQVEGGVEDVVACDSVADSDHDRPGMMSIASVDPRYDHHYSSSSSDDHDRERTSSCVPAKQSCPAPADDFPDGFWDFPADHPVHTQVSAEKMPSSGDHQGRVIIVDGSDDPTSWDQLGLSFINDLDEDPSSSVPDDIGFEGLWNWS